MKKIKLILAVLCIVGMLCSNVYADRYYDPYESNSERGCGPLDITEYPHFPADYKY